MRRFLLPASAALLSVIVVSAFLPAEDAPRAPRSVRRAARRAAREARETQPTPPVGLSDGLTSTFRGAPPTPRLAAQEPVFDQSEIIVFTSNANPPAPCRPVNLREDLFPVTSESNRFIAAGNIVQSEECLQLITSVGINEGRFEVFAGEQVHGPLQMELKPDVAAAAPASRPILQDGSPTGDVLSRVIVAGELAGLVLPEPGRLDPSILQASFNHLPVAVSGAIAFAEETPPPLPPREKSTSSERAAYDVWNDVGFRCPSTIDKTRSTGVSAEEARVWEALNQPVSLHFEQTQLEEIFRHIANSQGINIVIDDAGLAEAGVTTRDPISIHVEGVTLRSALKQILDARDLAWLVQDEVLKITSRQRSEGELFTQVYSVADLLHPISKSRSPVSQDHEPASPVATEEADFDSVTALIRTFVQPDSWNESGGPAALAPHSGSRSLVVRQTRRGHQEISVLLGCVRQIIEDVESSPAEGESSSPESGIHQTSYETSGESAGQTAEPHVAAGVLTIHPQTATPLTQLCSVHLDDASLGEFLHDLADRYGANFQIDLAGVASEGVTLETPVSIQVDGIQIKSVLNLILKPLNLEFEYRNGVVSITSRDRQSSELTTRLYPVGEILNPTFRTLCSGGSTPDQPLKGQLDAIIQFITTTIEPNGWTEFGGRGSIRACDSAVGLAVRQTERVHAEIADLLQQLRNFQDHQILIEVSAIRLPRDDFLRIKSSWGAEWYGNRTEATPEQFERLKLLLQDVDQTDVIRARKIQIYEGQTWRLARDTGGDNPFAFLTAITSGGRRCVDCNVAVPRTRDGTPMLQRISVFTTTVGNTCVINASEPSPVIENYAFVASGSFSDFGAIRELAPGEGDGVVWDESPDGVTLVFVTPRIIVGGEEEERLVPEARTSESGTGVQKESPPIITVTPRIIIQEEEEELLGIPLDPPSTSPRPDQGVMPPASWEVFGIPTHDLLFRDEEPERRLILQNP